VSAPEEPHARVADQAAEWATTDRWRIESIPTRMKACVAGLTRTLAAAAALLRAEAALSFVDRGRALAGVVPKPEPRPIWIRRKLMFAGAALAAGIVGRRDSNDRTPSLWHRSGRDPAGCPCPTVPLSRSIRRATRRSSDARERARSHADHVVRRGFGWPTTTKRPFIVSAGRIRVARRGHGVLRTPGVTRVRTSPSSEGVVETWTIGEEERRVRIASRG